ncbi:hypothetical protein D3C72_831930 [compost metagenome]
MLTRPSTPVAPKRPRGAWVPQMSELVRVAPDSMVLLGQTLTFGRTEACSPTTTSFEMIAPSRMLAPRLMLVPLPMTQPRRAASSPM